MIGRLGHVEHGARLFGDEAYELVTAAEMTPEVYANGVWGSISGKSFVSVVSSAHGFTSSGHLGIPITYGAGYQQAEANTPTHATVLGILSNVVDRFFLAQ